MCTTRPGSLKGRSRRKRSLIKLKIEVFSPIPSASVAIAMKVKPGDFRSIRSAYRRSFMSGLGVYTALLQAQVAGLSLGAVPEKSSPRRGRPDQYVLGVLEPGLSFGTTG